MRTPRFAESVALAALTALCLAAPVAAQVAIPRWPSGPGGPTYDQGSYDRGYRDGIQRGQQDARANRPFDYGRHQEYRNASRGRGDGSDQFRRGFEDGYRQGYERYARNGGYGYGGYGNGRYPDERYGYGYPGGYGYPTYGRVAFDRGFEDGVRKGREDGRDGDRFDPTRHKDYRKADDGYNRQYGSKDAYQVAYRDGFRSGYNRGYRENARGWDYRR
jgi:hypothetical protein